MLILFNLNLLKNSRIKSLLLNCLGFRLTINDSIIMELLLSINLVLFFKIGINQTEAVTVITSQELLPKFKSLLAKLPQVQRVIYMEDQLHPAKIDGFKDDVRIATFKDVIHLGSNSKAITSPPSAEDTAIIMYTSGSTGTPKGVLISHKNCISTLQGFSDRFDVESDDVMIGYVAD